MRTAEQTVTSKVILPNETVTDKVIPPNNDHGRKTEAAGESVVTESEADSAIPRPSNRRPRVKAQHEVRLNESVGRRLLNVRESAQYLGLEVDTIYRKARLRELPCVKVGRALRFDVVALDRYVEQHTIETID